MKCDKNFQQQLSQAQLKAIAEISALETDDQVVNPRHHSNDNPITTISTDVACSSLSLFCALEPATVSLTPVVKTY